jgi:hypothetical protein
MKFVKCLQVILMCVRRLFKGLQWQNIFSLAEPFSRAGRTILGEGWQHNCRRMYLFFSKWLVHGGARDGIFINF